MKCALVLVAVLVAACGSSDDKTLDPTDPTELSATLDALAAFGQKQPGTDAGRMAADYVKSRFEALGLADIHQEMFTVPSWNATTKNFSVSINGIDSTPGFDVFEASGSGLADGPIVDVGTAMDNELEGIDLTDKIAMVKRETSFHRSAQLRNVAAKGARAMLYLSVAPQTLRQVGSVRFGWGATEAIPAVTIGADDAKTIKDALAASSTVTGHINVQATSTPASGINVVGRIE